MSLIEGKKFTGETFLILIFKVHFHYASTILVLKLGLTKFMMMVMMMIIMMMMVMMIMFYEMAHRQKCSSQDCYNRFLNIASKFLTF